MFDNQLFMLIIATLEAQLAVAGISNVEIAQAYQPWRQGVQPLPEEGVPAPAAYLYKVSDLRDGFPKNSCVFDTVNEVEIYTQDQVYHSTFQLSTLSIQDPNAKDATTRLTASDVANLLSSLLQSAVTVQTFNTAGVGILDIKAVRNPYFVDDQDRFEASPNFDFTLVHTQTLTQNVPFATTVNFNILPVS